MADNERDADDLELRLDKVSEERDELMDEVAELEAKLKEEEE